MSATEQASGQSADLRSSVKLSRNASGRVQIEIKVRVGDDSLELDSCSAEAQRIYDEIAAKYPMDGAK